MNLPQHPAADAGPWHDRLGRAAIRSVQVLAVLTLLVIAVWVGVQLRLVVVPLLIAVLIAAAASPIVAWLNRRGLPRAPSVWATLLTGFAIFGGLIWAVARAAQDQWSELADGASKGVQELERFLAQSPLGLDRKRIEELWAQASEFLAGPRGQGVITGATLVVEILAGIFLGLVLLYFLLKDGERIWTFLRRELLPERHAHRFDRVAEEAVSTLGGYVRGTALIALVEATLIGGSVALLGVPLALPIAIVVFIGAFVPLLGATTAGALAALIASREQRHGRRADPRRRRHRGQPARGRRPRPLRPRQDAVAAPARRAARPVHRDHLGRHHRRGPGRPVRRRHVVRDHDVAQRRGSRA